MKINTIPPESMNIKRNGSVSLICILLKMVFSIRNL